MQEVKECLCCKGSRLYKYLDLGNQPLANNLKNSVSEPDEVFPLALNVCLDCFHSQLTISVDKDKLFKNYLYVSGTSLSLNQYFKNLASKIAITTGFGEKTPILDVACNDGTFLKYFKPYKWNLYGIDPAENLREDAVKNGIKIHTAFFPRFSCFGTKFKVITGLNVLAHTDTPYEFLVGCKHLLDDDGYIFIQTSQKDMVVNGEFDTVYHEHQSFFTIRSMRTLVERAGLYLENVEIMDVHGKSFLFTIRQQPCHFDNEELDNRYRLSTYESFQQKAEFLKHNLIDALQVVGLPLVGYGAAAKGVVLLNYTKIPVEYVVDDNPLKQGKVIGGVNVPIVTSKDLEKDKRDLGIVVFAWNMYQDIMRNIQNVRDQEDIFIKPFPKLDIS